MVILFVLSTVAANCQITKGNWLIGGNGSFSSQNRKYDAVTEEKFNQINITTDIGYVFIDKLAVGVRGNILRGTQKSIAGNITGIYKQSRIGVGPFARYYFLDTERRVNLLSEIAYQYVHYSNNSPAINGSSEGLTTFTAGPVLYLNTNVGMELTLNYEVESRTIYQNSKRLYLAIGLQIHLEKN